MLLILLTMARLVFAGDGRCLRRFDVDRMLPLLDGLSLIKSLRTEG